jgi:hypothetical protein
MLQERNAAKLRALKQGANYETFKNMVSACNLVARILRLKTSTFATCRRLHVISAIASSGLLVYYRPFIKRCEDIKSVCNFRSLQRCKACCKR